MNERKDDDAPRIEEREDGPFVARNITRMRGEDGAEIETKPVMALCRCGHSANKPFCDGSHKRVGFRSRGGTPAGRDRLIAYQGDEVTVSFNPLLCSHAAECNRLAPHVFDATVRPWVQPDNGSEAEVRAVVAACPSGALAIGSGVSTRQHLLPDRAEIVVQKDGPYWVMEIEPPLPPRAQGASADKYVLCRCGLSGNKPFCDGTHRDRGWTSRQG